jgi:amino acid transporter
MSNERYIRWQANTMAQLSATLSLLAGLSIGGLGFVLALARDRSFTPTGTNAVFFLVATAAFFIAALAGIAAFITRLLDFRLTARKIRNGGTLAEPLTMFGTEASIFSTLTWFLFWLLLIAMAIAVTCAAIVLSCTYLGRIIDAV